MKLVLYPDEVLKKVCEPVTEFNSELHKTLDEMVEIMTSNNGIGLAANQVGISKRFFILKDKHGKVWDFINPKILERSGGIQLNEGCLSAPEVFVQVPRHATVLVEAQDRNGEIFRVIAQDLEAVCVQHENDHLDGVFFIEKTNRNQRRSALRKLGLEK